VALGQGGLQEGLAASAFPLNARAEVLTFPFEEEYENDNEGDLPEAMETLWNLVWVEWTRDG
jgi:hypothetical protein